MVKPGSYGLLWGKAKTHVLMLLLSLYLVLTVVAVNVLAGNTVYY